MIQVEIQLPYIDMEEEISIRIQSRIPLFEQIYNS